MNCKLLRGAQKTTLLAFFSRLLAGNAALASPAWPPNRLLL
jgi:hypothetical protein